MTSRAKPKVAAKSTGARFDQRYYDRYYRTRATRVTSEREVALLGDFVFAYLRHLGQPVKRVLDAGCGLGFWRGVLQRHHPKARYTGLEYSTYLCETLGWTRGSIADYRPRGRFDLVICQGVLQYLTDPQAARAIDNLARVCRGALYLEVLTREDWRDNCDRSATDGAVHLRSAMWYRRRLARHFRSAGGGLYLHRDSGAVLYALEGA
jgi:SAM-dependent methyltransferase